MIDPNEEHQALSTIALGRHGFRVTVAGNGREGLRVAFSQPFEAIVLDSRLKDLAALDVLGLLRQRLPDVPKIFVVAAGQEAAAVRAMESGASGYLVKTARYNEILPSEVDTQIRAARARRSLKAQTKALGESEERFQKAFQASPVAACLATRSEGRLLDANEALVRLLGYSKEELVGHTYDELGVFGRDRSFADLRQRVLATDSAHDVEMPLRTKAGQMRTGMVSVESVEIDGVPCLLAIARDVTEERRVERLRAAVYAISEATASAKDMDGLFREIHRIVSGLMPADNFYIALYDPARDELSFPYFVDEKESTPQPYKAGKGVTEYVLRTGAPLLASPDVFQDLVARDQVALVGTDSVDWLGVPLSVEGRTIGVLAVQSYAPATRYTEAEKEILALVSSQIALAVERRRSDEALRRAERRFHTMIDRITDGISLLAADGTVVWQSSSAYRMFGFAPEEVLGQNPFQFVHPDDVDRIGPMFTGLIEHPGSSASAEIRIQHKDGTWRWVEAIGTNLLEHPDIQAVVLNYRDITDRVHAVRELENRAQQHAAIAALGQKALAESRLSAFLDEVVEALVETLQVEFAAILEVLPEAKELSLRARAGWDLPLGMRMTNPSSDTLIGYTLAHGSPVVMTDAETETRFVLARTLQGRGVMSGVTVAVPGHGGPYGILAAHSTRKRAFTTNEVAFCEAIANLVANAVERRRVERALSESDRLASMGQLAAYVGHEVNTPLTNISLLASSIARRVKDPEILEKLEAIAEQRRRASAIITDLLDVPKARSVRKSPEDVRQVIAAAVDQVAPYRRPEVTLTVEVGDHAVFANVDILQIRDVLVRLLRNALQATRAGTVAVRLSELPEYLSISVADTGEGMPPETVERLARSREAGGAGGAETTDGFATIRGVVAAHGGKIEVASELGQGSTFTVILPRFEAH